MEKNEIVKYFPNTVRVLEEYILELASLYQTKLRNAGHMSSGKLDNSINVDVTGPDFSLVLQDYWKYLEWDTKPHFPPVNSIKDWIKQKPVIPQGNTSTDQLAFLIGRKISRDGTKGGHYLEESMNELDRKFTPLINNAMEEDITLTLTEDIENLF